MEEELAVLYNWHLQSEKEAQHRAFQLRKWVDEERAAKRNPLSATEESSLEPWSTVHKRFEQSSAPVPTQGSQHCSTMATYVDDCQLDAHTKHEKLRHVRAQEPGFHQTVPRLPGIAGGRAYTVRWTFWNGVFPFPGRV